MEEGKGKRGEVLAAELKENLDRYILETPQEEYDEKVVESMLYLLDNLEPLDMGQVPDAERAWERFQRSYLIGGAGEDSTESCLISGAGEGLTKKHFKSDGDTESGMSRFSERFQVLLGHGNSGPTAKKRREGRKSRRGWTEGFLTYPGAVAAAFLVLVAACYGTTRAAAGAEGFFHWLRRDAKGNQAVVSPENLDSATEVWNGQCYSREGVPEWGQEWLRLQDGIDMPEKSQWQRFEISQSGSLRSLCGCFLDREEEQEVLIGVLIFYDKISYNSEEFIGYSYVGKLGEEENLDLYSRIEEDGEVFYAVSFVEGSCQYFVRGSGDLTKLQELAELYYECVRNGS